MEFVVQNVKLVEDCDVDQVSCMPSGKGGTDLFVLDVPNNLLELDKGDKIRIQFVDNLNGINKPLWDYIAKGYIWAQKKFEKHITWLISFGGMQMVYSSKNQQFLRLDTEVYFLLKCLDV